uniref:Cation efflux protein cytoplasmic domain-containing protein n=1 Tax=Chenopodium quinoa TaxID=63459 RepID=A0A803N9D5_CHEQI
MLKAKYFKNCDVLDSCVGFDPSFVWRSVWGAKSLLLEGLKWRVGTGSKISVWSDAWWPGNTSVWVPTPSVDSDWNLRVDPFTSVSAAHHTGEHIRHRIHESHPEVAEVFIHLDGSKPMPLTTLTSFYYSSLVEAEASQEFLESMQSQLVQQLAPSVTTAILTQLRDANPGINLFIPDFEIPSAPKDASSAPHLLVDQNGQSSKSGATIYQLEGYVLSPYVCPCAVLMERH